MAIVQISKIQHRRGREITGVGVPQLASGELGWSTDTQRLFIGNGSIAEGAPNIGNTEILTEHSDVNGGDPGEFWYQDNVEVASASEITPLFQIGNVLSNAVGGLIEYEVHYLYSNESETFLRRGTLAISAIKTTEINNVQISDEYDVMGDEVDDQLDISLFSHTIINIPPSTTLDTIVVGYTNAGDPGTLTFWYELN